MMKRLAALLVVLALAGCQTTLDPNYAVQLESYRLTITSQQNVEIARARAEEARYNALATIADRADPQTKSMAIIALALSRGGDAAARPIEVTLPNIPKTAEDRALAWASIFAGPTTALVSSYFGYQLGKVQSNNQAQTTIASYNSLASMKPAPIDFTKIPPTTDSHNVNNIWTTTSTRVTNDDGNVLVGPGDVNNNRPIAIVPPVTPIVPVVVVPPVVTGP
jgi:hypothetical protein